MKKFAIATLGCKVNSYESEAYIERCLQMGYEQVDFKEKADLYLINTCAVTNTAASKSRQKIHAAIKLNPSAFIGVVGCYSQTAQESVEKIEGVDVIVGSDQKQVFLEQLPALIENHSKTNLVKQLRDIENFESLPITKFSRHTRAFLKIQDGCNQFCAYCIIPFARGKERSLAEDEVIKVAQNFTMNHHHEIVLAGIHTGRYGHDLNSNLTTLLKRMLSEVDQLERIRISSIEITEISDELLTLMKHEPRIAAHLHIPVQSCCDKILKEMNRPYDIETFIQRVETIRRLLPNISISTDIIVGFPSETDEDFETSLANFERLNFSFAHVFPFSKRDNTVAASIKDIVGSATKKQRAKVLHECSQKHKALYTDSFVGKIVEVLVETNKDSVSSGHSSEYIPVTFNSDGSLVGKCVKIRITKSNGIACFGELED